MDNDIHKKKLLYFEDGAFAYKRFSSSRPSRCVYECRTIHQRQVGRFGGRYAGENKTRDEVVVNYTFLLLYIV